MLESRRGARVALGKRGDLSDVRAARLFFADTPNPSRPRPAASAVGCARCCHYGKLAPLGSS